MPGMTTEDERREKRNAYQREWRKGKPQKRTPEGLARRKAMQAEYHRRWKERHPEKVRELHDRYQRGRVPEQHRASEAVRRAIKAGDLVRPGACEECGKQCKPDAAHYDYADRFRVRWLCRSCHTTWDAGNPKGGYDPTGQARRSAAPRNAIKTHCKRGHEFTPENTAVKVSKDGRTSRRCKACRRKSTVQPQ